jgi:hypothetical protein
MFVLLYENLIYQQETTFFLALSQNKLMPRGNLKKRKLNILNVAFSVMKMSLLTIYSSMSCC